MATTVTRSAAEPAIELEVEPAELRAEPPPSISVVIPVKDDRRVADCLASIRACQPLGDEVEVIVVSNGSSAEFEEWAGNCLGAARVLTLGNAQVYRARNAGVNAANGDIVFFTDADCLVSPGWLAAGLAGFAQGADLLQGYSGTVERDRKSLLIQARYEKHLGGLAAGDPTECDTRNMAVRRPVFDQVRFAEAFRRVSDTEFGLRAEAAGLKVSYWPAMRVEHFHDPSIGLHVAKQVCHGWGSRRLMLEHPEFAWHSSSLKLAARVGKSLQRIPGGSVAGRVLGRSAVWCGYGLDRLRVERLPRWFASALVATLDNAAAAGGHMMYRRERSEPLLSEVAGRQLPRD